MYNRDLYLHSHLFHPLDLDNTGNRRVLIIPIRKEKKKKKEKKNKVMEGVCTEQRVMLSRKYHNLGDFPKDIIRFQKYCRTK